MDFLAPVPADRREAARAALAEAFGPTGANALAPVTGGASGALTYRVEAEGRPWLLRLEPPQRGGLRNNHRSFACMRAAEAAGLAPALRHADPDAGVAIMDFITQRPLSEHPGGAPGIVRELGGMVARLQATEAFPTLGAYPDLVARLLGFIAASGVFAPGLLEAHRDGLERIREAYAWDADALVSAHNDPNARNLLFDGQRLWLIDWELSFRNDPLVDVAIVAENFTPTADLETALLEAWRGGASRDRLIRARLSLMRTLTRLYYACLLFSALAGARAAGGSAAPPIGDLSAPSVAEFTADVAEGRLVAGSPQTAIGLGKMMFAGFLAGLAAPGFDEALAIARQG